MQNYLSQPTGHPRKARPRVVFALPFMRAENALASVALATSAFVAKEHTGQQFVKPNLPTPIDVNKIAKLLNGYPAEEKTLLVNGFTHGFRVPHDGDLPPPSHKSLSSAIEHRAAVQECINTELAASRIAGPFDSPPFDNLVLSPIGVVPKKVPGKFRLIHHLSYPLGNSINSGIDKQFTTIQYHDVDMAIQLLLQIGQGAYLAKTDIKSAFRLLPVHPDSYHLLGFYFDGAYYFDKCMPMGLSISCQLFEKFSTALQWIAQNHLGITSMLHTLDDFLFLSPSCELTASHLNNFQSLCQHLGVPLANDKTQGPSQCLSFAGIELDTVAMEARLPLEKVNKYHTIVSEHSRKKKTTLRELQSLIGVLNHCCYIVPPGRAFLCRLINLTKGTTNPHFHIRYNSGSRADLLTWATFLSQYNGRTMFVKGDWNSSDLIELCADASHLGFGAILSNHWFNGTWPPNWTSFHITLLELYPIVAAFLTWPHLLANKKVHILTDNSATMHIINSCSSKDNNIMVLIRIFVLQAMRYNIVFKSSHIPGLENRKADALSRLQLQEFHQLSPNADPSPTAIPAGAHPADMLPK